METKEKVKIVIVSGFLGAGKTTLIKKILDEGIYDERLAIIENEFGDIRIDEGRLEETGVEIRSLSSGCICCTLAGNFKTALETLVLEQQIGRILIEPTGIGRLSDIIAVVRGLEASSHVELDVALTVVDALDFEDYLEVFGDFFTDQIRHAQILALSKVQLCPEDTVDGVIRTLQELNPQARIAAAPWDSLVAATILDKPRRGCVDHRDPHESNQPGALHQSHNHEAGTEPSGQVDHDHGDDPVFEQWSLETATLYSRGSLEAILRSLSDPQYGKVLRAKGTLPAPGGLWLDFDLVTPSYEITEGKPRPIGQAAVIGQGLDQTAIADLFRMHAKESTNGNHQFV